MPAERLVNVRNGDCLWRWHCQRADLQSWSQPQGATPASSGAAARFRLANLHAEQHISMSSCTNKSQTGPACPLICQDNQELLQLRHDSANKPRQAGAHVIKCKPQEGGSLSIFEAEAAMNAALHVTITASGLTNERDCIFGWVNETYEEAEQDASQHAQKGQEEQWFLPAGSALGTATPM